MTEQNTNTQPDNIALIDVINSANHVISDALHAVHQLLEMQAVYHTTPPSREIDYDTVIKDLYSATGALDISKAEISVNLYNTTNPEYLSNKLLSFLRDDDAASYKHVVSSRDLYVMAIKKLYEHIKQGTNTTALQEAIKTGAQSALFAKEDQVVYAMNDVLSHKEKNTKSLAAVKNYIEDKALTYSSVEKAAAAIGYALIIQYRVSKAVGRKITTNVGVINAKTSAIALSGTLESMRTSAIGGALATTISALYNRLSKEFTLIPNEDTYLDLVKYGFIDFSTILSNAPDKRIVTGQGVERVSHKGDLELLCNLHGMLSMPK